ncbi:MAG: LemA family protein [Bryobacteraceae bacterium]|jgi:LemA protein
MPPIRVGASEHIASWRSAAAGTTFDEGRAVAENQLTGALRHLLAMAEEHPQLRASEEFRALERNLKSVEESLRNARRDYNDTVRDYNRRVRMFPGKILAGLLGLQPKPLFELSSAEEKESAPAEFHQTS